MRAFGGLQIVRAPHAGRERVVLAGEGVVVEAVISRGDGEDLDVRVPRDRPGDLPEFLDVRVPADGPGGLLPGSVVAGGANGATHEATKEAERAPRGCGLLATSPQGQETGDARAGRAAGVGWNLQEPRHAHPLWLAVIQFIAGRTRIGGRLAYREAPARVTKIMQTPVINPIVSSPPADPSERRPFWYVLDPSGPFKIPSGTIWHVRQSAGVS